MYDVRLPKKKKKKEKDRRNFQRDEGNRGTKMMGWKEGKGEKGKKEEGKSTRGYVDASRKLFFTGWQPSPIEAQESMHQWICNGGKI